MPSSASDISFYRNKNISGLLVYEFHMTRKNFEELAIEKGWALELISSPKLIWRYGNFLAKETAGYSDSQSATVEHGLFYEARRPNGGGITVVYDEASSTAYVLQSNR